MLSPSTLASIASSFLPNVHRHALTAEVDSTATDVLTALQEPAHVHLSLIKSANKDNVAISTSKTAGDTYLTKTGVVHELITQAKDNHPQGLSRTNVVAVRKPWREHLDLVADAAAVLEIEANPPDNDDDDFDDGWGDLMKHAQSILKQLIAAHRVQRL
jgi:hypothetical protein